MTIAKIPIIAFRPILISMSRTSLLSSAVRAKLSVGELAEIESDVIANATELDKISLASPQSRDLYREVMVNVELLKKWPIVAA